MQSEHISYDADGVKAELDVSAATVLQGARRARLRSQAKAQATETTDVDSFILRLLSYPDICAVTAGTINETMISWQEPLTFELFQAVPEPLMIQVEAAVYRLNPHWLPTPPAEEQKKAATTSTAASSRSITHRRTRKRKSRSRT